MPEIQSFVSDPRVHSIDGPMCRWSLKDRGSNEKVEFMRKQTRWITSSKEIAEVLRGDGRWKRDRRDFHMTGKSETAVAKLNKTMYGTQDASNAWQKLWCEHLRNNGFELGASNPALYRSELVNGFCHGDDFVTAAAEDQFEVFGKLLQEKFDTRRIGMVRAAKHLDKELEVLH